MTAPVLARESEDLDGNSPTAATSKLAGSSEDEMDHVAVERPRVRDLAPAHELEHAPRLFRHSVELLEEVRARRQMPGEDACAATPLAGAATACPLACCLPPL